jgi:hypothetical protein
MLCLFVTVFLLDRMEDFAKGQIFNWYNTPNAIPPHTIAVRIIINPSRKILNPMVVVDLTTREVRGGGEDIDMGVILASTPILDTGSYLY